MTMQMQLEGIATTGQCIVTLSDAFASESAQPGYAGAPATPPNIPFYDRNIETFTRVLNPTFTNEYAAAYTDGNVFVAGYKYFINIVKIDVGIIEVVTVTGQQPPPPWQFEINVALEFVNPTYGLTIGHLRAIGDVLPRGSKISRIFPHSYCIFDLLPKQLEDGSILLPYGGMKIYMAASYSITAQVSVMLSYSRCFL
jgi:hypothetical protein